jgi:7-cyano-7-deazaguanine synthase
MLYDLHAQGCKIHCCLFDYKQRHVQELQWAKHHCQRLGVLYTTIELPQLRGSTLTDGSGGVVVPCRNPIMLSLAVNLAVSAGAEAVTFAANKDDEAGFPDCRMAFVQLFNTMLTTAEIQVEVCAPYLHKPKWWIAALGQELGVKFNETWSCYHGGAVPCGECAACKKREAALKEVG